MIFTSYFWTMKMFFSNFVTHDSFILNRRLKFDDSNNDDNSDDKEDEECELRNTVVLSFN